MRILSSIDEFDAAEGSVLAVGVFDGLHLGHARIVRLAVETARDLRVGGCVLTFDPHPRTVLAGTELSLVISVEHRLELLSRAGVATTIVIPFTREFAAQPADAFVRDVVRGRLGARVLVLGSGARLGAGAHADARGIARVGAALGMNVHVVEPVLLDGARVSSTRVRDAICNGDLPLAEKLLGRRVSVLGTVVRGRGVGRRLGFPTANVDVRREVRPPLGVYASWATCDGARLASVTNVGFRPTFDRAQAAPQCGVRSDRLVEVHLLDDAEADYYGKRMEVEFVRHLRDERTFATDAELSAQIARDVATARTALDGDGTT
jgi:riboflavin kinase/FMN adenylyltransferase